MVRVSILLALWSVLLFARQASKDDAGRVVENWERHCYVRKDGSSSCRYLFRSRILKENKIQEDSNVTEYIRDSFQKETSYRVFVTNDGKKTEIPKENFQRAPVMNEGPFIARLSMVKAVIPGLKVGSVIELEFQWENFQQPIPGVYFDFFTFDSMVEIRRLHFSIESEIPLYVEQANPSQNVIVKNSKRNGHYLYSVENTKPLWFHAVEENYQAPSLVRDFVSISGLASWKEYVSRMEPVYETTLGKPLPPLYQEIVKKALKETNDLEQVKRAITELSDQIYYVQEYMGPSNSFYPRSLESIVKSKYGDCKDYSASLVAILRKMGWEAYVAVVESSRRASIPKLKIPSAAAFNHAIVYAKKNGNVLWLDPTQKTGYAEDISLYNADRPALILTNKLADNYVTTPSSDVSKNMFWSNYETSLMKDDATIDFNSKVYMTGHFATLWTGYEKDHSRQETRFGIQEQIEGSANVKTKTFEFPKLDTWFYTPIEVKISGTKDHVYLSTSAGWALDWDRVSIFDYALTEWGNRITDLDLNFDPGIRHYEKFVLGAKLQGEPFRCEVKSKWFDFERSYTQVHRGLYLSDREILKKRYVTVRELKSKEYADFRRQLERCAYRVAVVFTPQESTQLAE